MAIMDYLELAAFLFVLISTEVRRRRHHADDLRRTARLRKQEVERAARKAL